MWPPGTAAYGRQDARVPEPQKGGSRLVTRRVERAEPGSRELGAGSAPLGRARRDCSSLRRLPVGYRGARFLCNLALQWSPGSSSRPSDPGRAVAVTSVAGLSYLSNCVSGARPRAGVGAGGWGAHGTGRRPILGAGPLC